MLVLAVARGPGSKPAAEGKMLTAGAPLAARKLPPPPAPPVIILLMLLLGGLRLLLIDAVVRGLVLLLIDAVSGLLVLIMLAPALLFSMLLLLYLETIAMIQRKRSDVDPAPTNYIFNRSDIFF